MGKLLKLPSSFLFSGTGGGVLHGSTSETLVCTLVAARDQALKKLGGWANITKLVVYASDQTHFTFQKAAKLVGIPPSNFRVVDTSFSTRFSMSPEHVRFAIQDDIKSGLKPLYLCATVGTTTCGAVDPVAKLGKVAKEFKLWFHIDAAYAGSACICPENRHHLDGIELANSISMDAHKWFLINMDCCCLWIEEPRFLTDSLSTDPDILRNNASKSEAVVDYKDWQIASGRRFRALKVWMVIRRHGLANLICHIQSDIDMAKQFEALVAKDERFEVMVPRNFALVCFRLKSKQETEGTILNRKLLDSINSSGKAFMTHANSSGKAFMTHAVLGGVYVIRCAIGATLTENHHVEALWKLIQEKADQLLFEDKVN